MHLVYRRDPYPLGLARIGGVTGVMAMAMNHVWKEFLSNPIPFCGGLLSGLLGLDVKQDPLRSWLESQGLTVEEKSGNTGGPTSISIE